MKLLVPLDISQPVDTLELAGYTAQRLGAEVHLFTVIAPDRPHDTFQPVTKADGASSHPAGDYSGGDIRWLSGLKQDGPLGTMVETRDQAIYRMLFSARDRLNLLATRIKHVPVTANVAMNKHPAAAIAEYVARHDIDLVLMRTHGRHGVGRAVLGSVAEDVVRVVAAPVMLVGPGYAGSVDQKFDELIVCVDGSALSEEILPLAAWVRTLNMRVTVVTAVRSGHGSEDDKASYVRRVVEGLRARDVDASWALIPGPDAAAAIVNYAFERPSSIVSLVTHSRSGLPRLILGSVAMHVIRESPNPVLVLRGHRQFGPDPTPEAGIATRMSR